MRDRYASGGGAKNVKIGDGFSVVERGAGKVRSDVNEVQGGGRDDVEKEQ